jgi:hypothetical protein
MKFNGIKTHRIGKTMFIPLPVKVQQPIDGCDCKFCKAHPDRKPMWDTLAISPDSERTWTVHYPEIQRA